MKIIRLLVLFIFITTPLFLEAKITVISVKGIAAYRIKSKWIPIKKGINLNKGTEIMTSARSKVILKFDNHDVTINPMTKIKLYNNLLTSQKSINQVGLKFGSVRAKINSKDYKLKKIKTIFKISTPVATSSVRGTEEEVSYWPAKGMTIEVISGVIDAENQDGILNKISGNQFFSLNKGYARGKNILARKRGNNITIINSRDTTDDEKEIANLGLFTNIDNVDTDNDSALFNNPITNSSVATTNIEIVWPQ